MSGRADGVSGVPADVAEQVREARQAIDRSREVSQRRFGKTHTDRIDEEVKELRLATDRLAYALELSTLNRERHEIVRRAVDTLSQVGHASFVAECACGETFRAGDFQGREDMVRMHLTKHGQNEVEVISRGDRGLVSFGEEVQDTYSKKFKDIPDYEGRGTSVSVSSSSSAEQDACWLRLAGECHLREDPRPVAGIECGVARGDLSAHLGLEEAKLVRDRINAWIASVQA